VSRKRLYSREGQKPRQLPACLEPLFVLPGGKKKKKDPIDAFAGQTRVFSEGAHERPGALQPIHPGGAVVAVGQEKGVGTSFFNQPLAARARWRRSLKAPGTRGLKQRRQRGPGELECLCLLLSLSLSLSRSLLLSLFAFSLFPPLVGSKSGGNARLGCLPDTPLRATPLRGGTIVGARGGGAPGGL